MLAQLAGVSASSLAGLLASSLTGVSACLLVGVNVRHRWRARIVMAIPRATSHADRCKARHSTRQPTSPTGASSVQGYPNTEADQMAQAFK